MIGRKKDKNKTKRPHNSVYFSIQKKFRLIIEINPSAAASLTAFSFSSRFLFFLTLFPSSPFICLSSRGGMIHLSGALSLLFQSFAGSTCESIDLPTQFAPLLVNQRTGSAARPRRWTPIPARRAWLPVKGAWSSALRIVSIIHFFVNYFFKIPPPPPFWSWSFLYCYNFSVAAADGLFWVETWIHERHFFCFRIFPPVIMSLLSFSFRI